MLYQAPKLIVFRNCNGIQLDFVVEETAAETINK